MIPLTLVLLSVAACDVGSGNSYSSGNNSSGSGVSSSVSCVNDVCKIEIAGDPSGSRLGVFGRSLRVARLEADAVTVSLPGGEVRIPAGGTETIDGLRIQVVEAGEGKAELEVRRG